MLIFLAALTLVSCLAVLPLLFGVDPSRGRVMAAEPIFPDVPVVTFDSRGFV